METTIEAKEALKFKQVITRLADLAATFEAAEHSIELKEKELKRSYELNREWFQEQIKDVQQVLHNFTGELESFTSDLNLARMRTEVRKGLELGENHLQEIERATQVFVEQSQQAVLRLEKATSQAMKMLSQTVLAFNADELSRTVENNCELLLQQAQYSFKQVNQWMRRFHLKSVALVLSVTLVVSMIMGLYMNNEWPWETHTKVMQERNLAQAVLSTWPLLSMNDQEQIARNMTQKG